MPRCSPVPTGASRATARAFTKPRWSSWTRQLWRTLQPPGDGSGSDAQRPLSRMLLTYCLFLLLTSFSLCLANCPDQCDCKWKYGKETVECKRANFMVVPDDLDKGTQILDISYNNLQVLPKDTFLNAQLVHLQKIYMMECSLSQIDQEAFRSLSNLVELDISSNQMTYVPSGAIREVPQLRRLSMNSNPLNRILEGSFTGLASLELLELSHCDIEEIEVGAFQGLEHLNLLKLDGNRLQNLDDKVVEPLVLLNTLHLHANPWKCDCRLKSLRQWMINHNVPFNVPPTCSLPARFHGKTWNDLQLDDYACEPQVIVEADATELLEGDNVTLTCHASANPEPYVWWTWQGKPISNVSATASGQSYLLSEEGVTEKVSRLSIMLTDKADSGTYACVAENVVSSETANVTLKVGVEVVEVKDTVISPIIGIVVGIGVIILLLIIALCVLTMRCKHVPKSDSFEHKHSDANHRLSNSINHRDTFMQLEEQDLSLLGPNPIQKPPRLGQYHGVPTVDLDNYDKVEYMGNNVPPHWNTHVVVEFAPENLDDETKCLRHDIVPDEHMPSMPMSAEDDMVKETCLRPIVEEDGGIGGSRESEEGDDSGLELDRGREMEVRGSGFSDADSDKERLQQKNRRNQEKRTPLCPRDPSAIERELIGGGVTPHDRLRHNRQTMQRGSSGGGGDSTCSSSDPPTVPSSPQRQQHPPPMDKVVSLVVPSILLKRPRSRTPNSLEDEGEDGTEV